MSVESQTRTSTSPVRSDHADCDHRSAQAARLRTDPADYNVSVTDAHRERGSVVFTAWVATVLLVVIPPLWIALALTSSRVNSMRLVRRWARRVFAWCGCSPQITGLQHLEPERGAIIVANHSSYLDSVVLLAVIRSDYRFVANHRELARPFVGLVLRKGRHLIVDRGSLRSRGACMQAMLDVLEHSTSLVLFPEGTRSANRLQGFKIGAFHAAFRSGRPIVPVAITGTERILPRHRRLLRRADIAITILPAIYPGTDSQNAAQLRAHTAAAIARVLDGS
jgi:1-acyl-sn-glycerol-3-phosphate acyltransferase